MLNLKNLMLLFLYLFLIITSSLFFYFQIFHTWYEPDEAVFLLGGRLLHNGFALYRDYVDNKPPLIFILSYFLSFLDIIQLRILLFVLLVISIVILYAVIKDFLEERFLTPSIFFLAFFISFPSFDVLTLRLEQLLIFFSSFSMYFYFKRGNLLLSSFFLSLFPFLKPTYAILWLIFFFMDKRLVIPTLVLSFFIFFIFLVAYGKNMIDAIYFISSLKAKYFYKSLGLRISFGVFLTFLILLSSFSFGFYIRDLLKNKAFATLSYLSFIYVLLLILGFFSFSPYAQVFTPFVFFSSVPFFISLVKYCQSITSNKITIYYIFGTATLLFVLIALLFSILFMTQFDRMRVNSTKGFSVVGAISKEDAYTLYELKSSGRDVYIASRDASLYYPFFIDKVPNSIKPSEALEKDGLFVCFTGCMGIIDGEYEYLLKNIERNVRNGREFIVFDRTFGKDGKCYSAGMFCINNTYLNSLLNSNGYELYYSGNSIEVLQHFSN